MTQTQTQTQILNYRSGHTRSDPEVMVAVELVGATDEVGSYSVPGTWDDASPLRDAIASYDRRMQAEADLRNARPAQRRRRQRRHTTIDDDAGRGGGGLGF